MGTEELVEFDPEKIKDLPRWILEDSLRDLGPEGIAAFEVEMQEFMPNLDQEQRDQYEAALKRSKEPK